MISYVQLNITGRKRDRRTHKLYRWCIVVEAPQAERKARTLRRCKHVSRVDIVQRGETEL
ncbi:MAG TPA: hypothetical protein VN764_13500 [Polyangiaceae bacterium]|nr:hypothetical protein [Polyangiaceae bacterium]